MGISYVKRRKLKVSVRILLMLLILGIFVQGVIFVGIGIASSKNNDVIYEYAIEQDVDYHVDIYRNSLFEEESLSMDQTYISIMVKNIHAAFQYEYKNSKQVPLKYKYGITATIYGEYMLPEEKVKSQLWNKEYVLLETTEKETSDNIFWVEEEIDIDYDFYNDVVADFKKKMNMSITSYLLVCFEVEVDGGMDGKDIGDTESIQLKIPLQQQAFKIEKEYEEKIEKNILRFSKEELDDRFKKEVIGFILIGLAIILFILLYKDIFGIRKKNFYNVTLDKLLKQYGDIIVEVTSEIRRDGMQVIEVKDFKEMLDLEDELKTPIVFYEIIKDKMGEFVICHNHILYRFILKNH